MRVWTVLAALSVSALLSTATYASSYDNDYMYYDNSYRYDAYKSYNTNCPYQNDVGYYRHHHKHSSYHRSYHYYRHN